MGNEVSIRCGDRTDTSFEDMLRKDYPANDASKARLTMMRSFLAREDMADASISLEAILSVYHKLWGINTQDDFMSLLHGVVWKSKLRCSRAVLAHPSLDVGVRNDKGETALLFALLYSRSDAVCELLLTKPAVRASVLVSDDDKAKCLHAAAKRPSAAILMQLLTTEAWALDPTARDKHNATLFVSLLLHPSYGESQQQAFEWLLARNDMKALLNDATCITPLVAACHAGRTQCVQQLLAAGAKAAVATVEGETPLIACAECNDEDQGVECAKLLLQQEDNTSALVNHRIEGRVTALHVACKSGRVGLVKYFLCHGADAVARCDRGTTPLFAALHSDSSDELVPLLVAREDVQHQLRTQPLAEPTHPFHAAIQHDNRTALNAMLPFTVASKAAGTTEKTAGAV